MSKSIAQTAATQPSHPAGARKPTARRIFNADHVLRALTTGSALVVILMLVGLLAVLTRASLPSIKAFGFGFVTSREWRPNELEQPKRTPDGKIVVDEDGEQVTETLPASFGALPVIYGTVVSSLISLLFAVPLSMGAAIFLVRIVRPWAAMPISFLIEFLAAIPSIAYGIWGLFVLCPFLQQHVEPRLNSLFASVPGLSALSIQNGGVTGRDMLAGGLILGVMIVPIITAISRDVLRNVPRTQVEGTVALGATWWQSSKEMLKFSRSGLFGATMLGLARAAGETMAITMVIGNNNQIRTSLFAPAQTMSSMLANEFAEASTDLHRAALTEVALILLLMSLLFNVVARYLVVGKQSRTAIAH
jgi:phosphate transport system permease protein